MARAWLRCCTRPRKLTLYKGLVERYVKPVIGGVRLDKLTPAHVQRLVTETRNTRTSRGTPPSASTLRHVYKLVRNALGDAYRMELVTRNVATQVKAPRSAASVVWAWISRTPSAYSR